MYSMGPILFNISIADLFLVVDDIELANYADDNTIYCCNDRVNDVIVSLTESVKKFFQWFSDK